MVVPVLMTSCQVSLKWKIGPVAAQIDDDRRGNRKRARMPRRSGGPLGQPGKRSRDTHSR